MKFINFSLIIILSLSFNLDSTCQAVDSYTQHKNIVYSETAGIGLLMDIFVPKDKKNGLAIVDIASGAWHSDRGKINDHKMSQTYEYMCKRGFIVFAVRPGSITHFSGMEMLENIRTGIKWVKSHAEEYQIDPDKLGLMGASAGGHLACLTALTADDTTRVAAAGIFFPPTDLLNYGDSEKENTRLDRFKRLLAFSRINPENTPEELKKTLKAISPVYHVSENAPPFLLIHGDADKAVPLNQSQRLLKKLKEKNIPAQLIIKKGGGHPWLTIHEEVAIMADWFVKELSLKSN
jgi:acetyl esterase/lipase